MHSKRKICTRELIQRDKARHCTHTHMCTDVPRSHAPTIMYWYRYAVHVLQWYTNQVSIGHMLAGGAGGEREIHLLILHAARRKATLRQVSGLPDWYGNVIDTHPVPGGAKLLIQAGAVSTVGNMALCDVAGRKR